MANSGVLTINPGQKGASIAVVIKGDQLAEGTETFFVNLGKPTNATLADAQAVGTIVDNEK